MPSRDNVAGLVLAAAGRSGEAVAVTGPLGTLRWRELAERARALAGWLAAAGLRPGERVGLLLANGPEFALGYFGALWAGLVAVPVNTGYPLPELTHQLGDSGARLLLTDAAHGGVAERLAGQVGSLDRVLVCGTGEWDAATAPAGAAAGPPEPVGGGEDLAALLYTSGTSGLPRGAMLSHRALLANLEQLARLDPPPVAAGDVALVVVPLFHVYGLNAGLGMIARQAATAVFVDRFDPAATLRVVAEYAVSAVVAAPPVYVAWSMLPDVGAVLGGVRLLLSGAAPLPVEVGARLRERTGRVVHEGYGLTETAPVLTTTLGAAAPKPGSVGRPVPGVALRLLADNGEPVAEGDPGEVTVCGPNLFSGYWPDASGGPDAAGWFATGDVAYADGDGALFLVDRLRELVLVSGFNVYPQEVERVLLGHPGVAEAAVLGVPHPYTGQSVKAFVVARPGAGPTQQELVEYCARSLARFKCPTAVELVEWLPHSATGKVSKARLRERGTDLIRTRFGSGRRGERR